jgi:hypothetical protein
MDNFVIVVCEGMHPPEYTAAILATIAGDALLSRGRVLVFSPASPWQVLSGWALRQWLEASLQVHSPTTDLPPLIVWAFSAGCVGMASLVTYWQRYRQPILACFALDGWGVPLPPEAVPIYRLSHDHFTHATSQWLGCGPINFYADPAVPHQQLWQSPQTVRGWQVTTQATPAVRQPSTAAEFLCYWSRHHLI